MSFVEYFAMRYRSRTDIVAQILEAANGGGNDGGGGQGGATQAKIMYNAFLPYAQLKEYLTLMVENGLLKYDERERIYKSTEKSNRFLRLYNQIEVITPGQGDMRELPRM
jgi:predicted transcriptional regulator